MRFALLNYHTMDIRSEVPCVSGLPDMVVAVVMVACTDVVSQWQRGVSDLIVSILLARLLSSFMLESIGVA